MVQATLFPLDDSDSGDESGSTSLRQIRARYFVDYQHRVLDWLMEFGTCFIPDLSDQFETPPRLARVFIGTAVRELAKNRVICTTGERRIARSNGRHANIYEVWRLAPGVDAAFLSEWRKLNPIPETSEPKGRSA